MEKIITVITTDDELALVHAAEQISAKLRASLRAALSPDDIYRLIVGQMNCRPANIRAMDDAALEMLNDALIVWLIEARNRIKEEVSHA